MEVDERYQNSPTSRDKLPSVNPLLGQLLDGVIDYAGLFPPAQLGLEDAFGEFQSLPTDVAWLADLFVCPSNKLAELDALARRKGVDGLAVSVIGNPVESPDKALASFERDIQRMEGCANLEFGAYEVRIGHHGEGGVARSIKALDRSGILDLVDDAYVELGWPGGLEDCLHELAAINPEFGAKARTGGTTADAFPGIEQLALFIHTAVNIEIPFKMTAGLHDPLRHWDESLSVHRHGFLNVCLAGLFALAADLSTAEIGDILAMESPDALELGGEMLIWRGHQADEEAIRLFKDWFGGFGSCSIAEPVDGLKKLGYWTA